MPVPVPVPGGPPPDDYANALVPVQTDASMNLLNQLLAFYHQERSWVHRTRASLELAFVQGPLLVSAEAANVGRLWSFRETSFQRLPLLQDSDLRLLFLTLLPS